MWWLILAIICGIVAVTVLVLWRKWGAPWRQIEELVTQMGRGERPPTFLVDGGADAQRVGLALESIFARQQELDRQMAGRESGTQTILGAMQDGLLVVDARRSITLMNQTFENLFRLRNPAAGVPLLETVRHATLDWLIADTLRTGEAMRSEFSLADSQTHSERHIEVNAVPIKNALDETTGAVLLFHDITELKRLDQIRSDFVANVSHELRTPLSILRGYVETLLDNPKTPHEELLRILRVMERHSNRLELLVEDLLTLAQLESGNPDLQLGIVDLSEFLREMIRDWEKKLTTKQISIVVDIQPKLS